VVEALEEVAQTLNAMSLTAIVLLMGILVDDAVVVSENTHRLRREGMPLKEASIQGASQISSSCMM
jgi:HAE1 family hydrophobic/amphiphilic exporter-1